MVDIGFIVEGRTEKRIIESEDFSDILSDFSLNLVHPVIDAKGNNNLLPHNKQPHIELLLSMGAQKVLILTDLDKDECITMTKQRVRADQNEIVVVAVQAIESWFIADTKSLSSVMKKKITVENPESIKEPFNWIKRNRIANTNQGVSKNLLTSLMIKHGFSLKNAAKHPKSYSSKYFINKLLTIGS